MNLSASTKRIEENLEHLKQFTSTHGNGCTRLPFSKETRDAAEYLKDIMRQAGMEVREDCVGNIFGVLPGKDREKPCVMSGSHYDSVYNGGNYDGIAGVVCAIELARLVQERGIELEADYVVAAFMDEEGCRFGTGYFGSKCMLGQMTVEECKHFTDKDGISVYEAMRDYGFTPENLGEAAWDLSRIGKFIEMHIEQGPVLDKKEIELGLVNCIVGIHRYMVTVNGRADHAGTTPMDMRMDAVDMGTKVVSKLADFAREAGNGTVATVGYVTSTPGAMNVVAQSMDFTVDIRSVDQNVLDDITAKMKAELDKATKEGNGTYSIDTKLEITPVDMNDGMLDIMEESCKKHGYSYLRMPSGAGHDSLPIGQIKDTVMLFVPSLDGRSHAPEEYTPYESFAKGCDVFVDLLEELQSQV